MNAMLPKNILPNLCNVETAIQPLNSLLSKLGQMNDGKIKSSKLRKNGNCISCSVCAVVVKVC